MAVSFTADHAVRPGKVRETAAGNLAARYDRMRGAIDVNGVANPAAARFASWLACRWCPTGPSEPDRLPDAVNASPSGIQLLRWYEMGEEVRGYVPGGRGCYLVPAADTDGGMP